GVVDHDRGARQTWQTFRQNCVDDCIVCECEMDAIGGSRGVTDRRGNGRASRTPRLELGGRPVPDGDWLALGGHALDPGAAEEACTEKRDAHFAVADSAAFSSARVALSMLRTA